MNYNHFDLVTVHVNGNPIVARPIEFDSSAIDQTSKNAFGNYVKPTKLSTICPSCGGGILASVNLSNPPFEIINLNCTSCTPSMQEKPKESITIISKMETIYDVRKPVEQLPITKDIAKYMLMDDGSLTRTMDNALNDLPANQIVNEKPEPKPESKPEPKPEPNINAATTEKVVDKSSDAILPPLPARNVTPPPAKPVTQGSEANKPEPKKSENKKPEPKKPEPKKPEIKKPMETPKPVNLDDLEE